MSVKQQQAGMHRIECNIQLSNDCSSEGVSKTVGFNKEATAPNFSFELIGVCFIYYVGICLQLKCLYLTMTITIIMISEVAKHLPPLSEGVCGKNIFGSNFIFPLAIIC